MTKSKPRPNSQASSAQTQTVTVLPLPAPPAASLLKQASKFLNTTAGLDLTLRLFQGIAIIAAKSSDDVMATRSFIAAAQLDLARRYLRFFVLLDCIQNVFETMSKDYASVAYKTLDLLEWSCLLMYFALENLTMLHDMKIHTLSWYNPVLVEANKFWFYAICASIVRTVIQRASLFSGTHSSTSSSVFAAKNGKKQGEKTAPPPPLRRLVIDALDLTLPASFIGWVVLDDVKIGCLMTISTLLVWRDIWKKAQ